MRIETAIGIFKFVAFILYSLFCLGIAILPESAMYFFWHLVAPQNQAQKIVLAAVFVFGGGGLSFVTAVFGFVIWIAGLKGFLDS